MIKLLQILKECFNPQQMIELLNDHPEILNILKNDPLVKKTGHVAMSKIDDLNTIDKFGNALAYYGGTCFEFGPKDWNKKNLINLFNLMASQEDIQEITPESFNKLKNIILNSDKIYEYNPENQKRWIKNEFNRIKDLRGEDWANRWLKNNKYNL